MIYCLQTTGIMFPRRLLQVQLSSNAFSISLLYRLFLGLCTTCDFDSDKCGFTDEDTDDFDWARHSGSTPSFNTGPTTDHTTGTNLGTCLQIGMYVDQLRYFFA